MNKSSSAKSANPGTVYYLTAAEIIELKTSGVSEKLIDCMINTASTESGHKP